MTDQPQTKNINVSLGSVVSDFVSTIWGKILALLAAISIIMGIALEVQSFVNGYYVLRKTAADAETAAIITSKTRYEECTARFNAADSVRYIGDDQKQSRIHIAALTELGEECLPIVAPNVAAKEH